MPLFRSTPPSRGAQSAAVMVFATLIFWICCVAPGPARASSLYAWSTQQTSNYVFTGATAR